MTYNPNSAFPRQSVYVPWTNDRHGVPHRAVNAPNYGNLPGGGFAAAPTQSYGNVVQQGRSTAAGAPSLAASVAALGARPGVIDAFAGKQAQKAGLDRHNAKRALFGQGKPAVPQADSVSAQSEAVIGSPITPIALAVNEVLARSAKRRGAAPSATTTSPSQGTLF